MNYLAHAYLSCSNEDVLFGNFIGDSVNAKTDDVYQDEILRGIWLHRQIDSFTDSHHLIKEAVHIFRPSQSKYAPVVTDILWDHALSKYWFRFSGEELRLFVDGVYGIISSRKKQLPAKLLLKIDQMIAGDFLYRYQTIGGLKTSYGYMDKRAKFPSNFQNATEVYQNNQSDLDSIFLEFFPDLISYVEEICAC